MVGVDGFEPPTARPPAECSTRLSYTPKTRAIITAGITLRPGAGQLRGHVTPAVRGTHLNCAVGTPGVQFGGGSAPQDVEHFFEFHAQLPDDLLAHAAVGLDLVTG